MAPGADAHLGFETCKDALTARHGSGHFHFCGLWDAEGLGLSVLMLMVSACSAVNFLSYIG